MRTMLVAFLVAVGGVHHTAAGNAIAHRALIGRSDVGPTWIVGTTPKKVGSLACGITAPVKGVVETGAAVSPTYRAGAVGPFVSESVFAYDSAASATRYFVRVARPNALACLGQSLAGGSKGQPVAFTISKQQTLPVPRVPATAAAYRLIGSAVTTAQKVRFLIDLVLIQRGSAIAMVSYSSFETPFPASAELRIARAAAARL